MALRVAVLLSGSGTTFDHAAKERAAGRLEADFVVAVSTKREAGGLERARQHGVAAELVERRAFDDEGAFNDALHAVLDRYAPELITLMGFLSRLEIRGYEGRVMNIHPALIPAFCGKGFYGDRVHRAVLESGVKLSGATVHFCDESYDTGPIILQKAVSVEDDDSVDSLRARVQAAEREIYTRAIQLFAQDRLRIEGQRVRILDEAPSSADPRP